jgi:hypothetical protein
MKPDINAELIALTMLLTYSPKCMFCGLVAEGPCEGQDCCEACLPRRFNALAIGVQAQS